MLCQVRLLSFVFGEGGVCLELAFEHIRDHGGRAGFFVEHGSEGIGDGVASAALGGESTGEFAVETHRIFQLIPVLLERLSQ